MDAGRIGFVSLCHADYVDDNVRGMTERAAAALEGAGVALLRADGPVTGWKQAREAGRIMGGGDVSGVIIFLGAWIECADAMALLREVEHLPLCLWGFPMFMRGDRLESTGSYVSYAMFRGVMERVGYRFEGILGPADGADCLETARAFAAAAHTAARLRRSRVGLVGYTSMSIYTGTFDHLLMRTRIGPEIVQSDAYTLISAAERMEAERVEAAQARIRELASIADDVSAGQLKKAAGIFAAMRELCARDELDAINIKCQYEFSKEYGAVACVPLSAIAEEGVTAGCEGDTLCTVSQLMLRYISGGVAAYGDAINHEGDVVKFSSCGMLPFSLGCGERCVRAFMPHLAFSGIQTSFVMRPGKVTFLRLVEDVGGYHMIYGAGDGLPTELRQGYMPALDVRVGDVKKLVGCYAGQHFALCYGDHRGALAALARILNTGAIEI